MVKCEVCNADVNSFRLLDHLRSHERVITRCDLCNKSYMHQNSLTKTIATTSRTSTVASKTATVSLALCRLLSTYQYLHFQRTVAFSTIFSPAPATVSVSGANLSICASPSNFNRQRLGGLRSHRAESERNDQRPVFGVHLTNILRRIKRGRRKPAKAT